MEIMKTIFVNTAFKAIIVNLGGGNPRNLNLWALILCETAAVLGC